MKPKAWFLILRARMSSSTKSYPMRLQIQIVAMLMLSSTLACGGTSERNAGSTCSVDTECATGLQCLAFDVHADGGCNTAGNACSKTCVTDVDCENLEPGANFKCFSGCTGAKFCGRIP